MSHHIETGGPAFPEIGNVAYNSDWQSESGMTLRDWFAGQALMGMGTWSPVSAEELSHRDIVQKMRAEFAYEQADAMIAAREPKTEGAEA